MINESLKTNVDRIEIVYYTDPLCCWSWAFEPQWRRLLYEFRDTVSWTYIMGGMIPDWKRYQDPMNSVSRPAQLGPLWMEAKYISGMPINDAIWIEEDIPGSSYPACIAFKCAELQSKKAGDIFLRMLREAVMLHKQNIAKQQTLFTLSEQLGQERPELFNTEKFKADFCGAEGRNAFAEDLQKTRMLQIGRFPTLTISKPGKDGLILTGYRPYQILLKAIRQIAPEWQIKEQEIDMHEYQNFWQFPLTGRELREVGNTAEPGQAANQSDEILR